MLLTTKYKFFLSVKSVYSKAKWEKNILCFFAVNRGLTLNDELCFFLSYRRCRKSMKNNDIVFIFKK